ncbi:MAG: X-Pro aminopeptidase [Rhodospirillaceae bacterium]|nr:X-Pro aminopeptidase [Rhodospirillaceae bacterium]
MVGDIGDPDLRTDLLELRTACRVSRAPGRQDKPAERLAALRKVMSEYGVDAIILPRADEHQGECIPHRAERLAWLTGFTGSAGVAIVLADKAAVFTDGRYTLQIRQQIDETLYEVRHVTNEPPTTWIEENLAVGARFGYDPWIHTIDGAERLRNAVERAGGVLLPLSDNPIDTIWDSQPAHPLTPIAPHDISYAGQSMAEKRVVIADTIAKDGHDAVILTSPESIAWLLNVRGHDVPRTPLPLSFGILDKNGSVDLFVDERKVTQNLRDHLGNAVTIQPRERLGPEIETKVGAGCQVRVDPASSPAWIAQRIEAAGGKVHKGQDPVVLPKAVKNTTELNGAHNAHTRDGLAFAHFLRWFQDEAPKGTVDEIQAADRLHACRSKGALFNDLSFDTISGSGPNGAIVHYRVTSETNRVIQRGDLYLVDSGAQYLDGTTDITRTIAVGDPGAEARDRFTRVLKCHIAIATARFPVGSTGGQLDTLGRTPLWDVGLDFDHGTGHGVGSYLGVHEGPQRISKAGGGVPLRPGMIISNEPGYYKEGAYGIRLENLVVVREEQIDGADRQMLGFDTITLAPFDRSMIDPSLLTGEELIWLNRYHARVRERLTPMLEPEMAAWLAEETAEI